MEDKKEKDRMLKQIVDALTGKKRYRENYQKRLAFVRERISSCEERLPTLKECSYWDCQVSDRCDTWPLHGDVFWAVKEYIDPEGFLRYRNIKDFIYGYSYGQFLDASTLDNDNIKIAWIFLKWNELLLIEEINTNGAVSSGQLPTKHLQKEEALIFTQFFVELAHHMESKCPDLKGVRYQEFPSRELVRMGDLLLNIDPDEREEHLFVVSVALEPTNHKRRWRNKVYASLVYLFEKFQEELNG